jgi:hypothetical protein
MIAAIVMVKKDRHVHDGYVVTSMTIKMIAKNAMHTNDSAMFMNAMIMGKNAEQNRRHVIHDHYEDV